MSTATQTKSRVIEFSPATNIQNLALLGFTKKYVTFLKYFKEYLKSNSGKFIKLKFTRMNENGFLNQIIEAEGYIQNVEETQFTFCSSYNLSGKCFSDDGVENIIRTDNVLGVIPVGEGIQLHEILEIDKVNHKDYNAFLKTVKKALIPCIGTKRHVEIHTSLYVIDATILEVNKSNLLIDQKRKYSKKKYFQKKWEFVDLIPQTYNLLFITKNDFAKKVIIYDSDLYINPYDED